MAWLDGGALGLLDLSSGAFEPFPATPDGVDGLAAVASPSPDRVVTAHANGSVVVWE